MASQDKQLITDPNFQIEMMKLEHSYEVKLRELERGFVERGYADKFEHMKGDHELQLKIMKLESELKLAQLKIEDLKEKAKPVASSVHNSSSMCSFQDSNIASVHAQTLRTWIGESRYAYLVYRGSRDGFKTTAMKARIKHHGETITIVKSTNGFIFGGYSPISWANRNLFIASPAAWLFSLGGIHGSIQLQSHGKDMHIYDHQSYGPTFGINHDLHIAEDCNMNNRSYTNVGSSFVKPSFVANAFFLNGGTQNFQVAEIEVYAILST
eukprot:TRINITY_DN2219_c0_g1_i6.p1 TRINITY_DN2219_c0_g1~~TRINITY_DN2219_c0_g1_i6.p1  ORF type:complete len:268 (+),score=31.46 TRINITY_DN2219_c0_g1_i6:60-863(+)